MKTNPKKRIFRGAYRSPKWKVAHAERLWLGARCVGVAVGLGHQRVFVGLGPSLREQLLKVR